MTKPIDRQTWDRFRAAWRSSRQLGKDFAEHLNATGLLLTPARRQDILAAELRRAAAELENASPAVFISHNYGSNNMSALDMQRATVAWLRDRASRIERG